MADRGGGNVTNCHGELLPFNFFTDVQVQLADQLAQMATGCIDECDTSKGKEEYNDKGKKNWLLI